MEALKIKLSKFYSQGKRVRILATTFQGIHTELRKRYADRYLVNIPHIEVMNLEEMCEGFNVKYDKFSPRETVNTVMRSLSVSSDPDLITLLLVDEVRPSGNQQTDPDWRDLDVKENVVFLLGLSPRAPSASSTEVLPPENSSVLTRHLVHKHRNCPQIGNVVKTIRILNYLFEVLIYNSGLINNVRTFYKYNISHHKKDNYLSMANDLELPDD